MFLNEIEENAPTQKPRDFNLVNNPHLCVCVCVRVCTYGCCRTSEGQTQQHQQWDQLIARLHVGHGEVTIMATVAHRCRGQHICQLQEVQGDQGGQDDGELHTSWTRSQHEQLAFNVCLERSDSLNMF